MKANNGYKNEAATRFQDRPSNELEDKLSRSKESSRGRFLLSSCRSGTYLARMVEKYLEMSAGQADLSTLFDIDFRFSDQESCVRLDWDANGSDVFLLQSLVNPSTPQSVDQNYMSFLIAARAFKEWGANSVTGILPYLAYARQDKPTRSEQEPTTTKLLADLSIMAGMDRLVVWHPHSIHIRGFYSGRPVDILDPVGLFVSEFRSFHGCKDVIAVAPDTGAIKFVTHFARCLEIPLAIASKHRPEPEKAEVDDLIGDFSGKKTAIILDDLISSGGTVHALIKKLVLEKGITDVYLGVSHNLCMDQAYQRIVELHSDHRLRSVVVTNSIPQTEAFTSLPFFHVRSLDGVIAQVIRQIHLNRSVKIERYWEPTAEQ